MPPGTGGFSRDRKGNRGRHTASELSRLIARPTFRDVPSGEIEDITKPSWSRPSVVVEDSDTEEAESDARASEDSDSDGQVPDGSDSEDDVADDTGSDAETLVQPIPMRDSSGQNQQRPNRRSSTTGPRDPREQLPYTSRETFPGTTFTGGPHRPQAFKSTGVPLNTTWSPSGTGHGYTTSSKSARGFMPDSSAQQKTYQPPAPSAQHQAPFQENGPQASQHAQTAWTTQQPCTGAGGHDQVPFTTHQQRPPFTPAANTAWGSGATGTQQSSQECPSARKRTDFQEDARSNNGAQPRGQKFSYEPRPDHPREQHRENDRGSSRQDSGRPQSSSASYTTRDTSPRRNRHRYKKAPPTGPPPWKRRPLPTARDAAYWSIYGDGHCYHAFDLQRAWRGTEEGPDKTTLKAETNDAIAKAQFCFGMERSIQDSLRDEFCRWEPPQLVPSGVACVAHGKDREKAEVTDTASEMSGSVVTKAARKVWDMEQDAVEWKETNAVPSQWRTIGDSILDDIGDSYPEYTEQLQSLHPSSKDDKRLMHQALRDFSDVITVSHAKFHAPHEFI